MKNYILDESVIGAAKVIVDIIPKGFCRPNTTINVKSITVHQTGNIDTTAKANHNYMKNINRSGSRIASWAFTVDDKEIYQALPSNNKAYHAGNATGNNTSIGIEICMFTDKEKQRKAYENAIALIKILMDYHNLSVNDIKQHYNWTKKDCPAWLRSGKYGYNWSWFINQLGDNKDNKDDTTPTESFTVKIICDELNIRSGPGTSYKVVGTVKKNQVFTIIGVSGDWGKLKSGAGWISLGSKYIKKQ